MHTPHRPLSPPLSPCSVMAGVAQLSEGTGCQRWRHTSAQVNTCHIQYSYFMYSSIHCTTYQIDLIPLLELCANYCCTILHDRSTWPIIHRCSSNEILRKWCNVIRYKKNTVDNWNYNTDVSNKTCKLKTLFTVVWFCCLPCWRAN